MVLTKKYRSRDLIGAAAVDLTWLNFGTDSSFQNVAEYMGGLIGLIGLIKLGISNVAVE